MGLDKKRWIILFACMLVGICIGTAYSLSVFAKPLIELLHITKAQWALAFSFSVIFAPISMLAAGRIVDRGNPRIVVFVSGILFGLGLFLASFTNSVWWLYGSFFVFSLGGASYGAIISTSVRWFPERKGFASGLTITALGLGTAIMAKLAAMLILHVGVLETFKILGLILLSLCWLSALIIVSPPEEYRPRNYVPRTLDVAVASVDLDWKSMLSRPFFWLLYLLYACGTFSGLMVISLASPVAQELAKLTPEMAATIVLALGLANAAGRVFWGFVSDRIGRIESLILIFLITAVTMFFLPILATQGSSLMLAVILVGSCFGGYLGTFPALCADAFGTRNIAVNYALLVTAFILAALIGPKVGGMFGQQNPPQYDQAFIIAGIVSAFGLLLSTGIKINKRRVAR